MNRPSELVALLLAGLMFAASAVTLAAPGTDSPAPSSSSSLLSIVPVGYVDSQVTTGASQPIALAFLPDGRLIWAEKTGRVRYLNGSGTSIILDITGRVRDNGEGGLLGLALDPDYPSRPYIYVHYTSDTAPPKVRVARFTFSNTGPNLLLDPNSEVIGIDDGPDDASNHNGGTVRFDSLKRLVVSVGEDAIQCEAQNPLAKLGKLLRLRVDTWSDPGNQSRLVPPDNPFIAHPNVTRKLTFIEGLRNPFRFDVDRVTGDFLIGDVGAGAWEEVSLGRGGENMGWPYFEGNHSRAIGLCAGQSSIPANVKPVYEYPNSGTGAAVMGTMVYRGRDWPNNSFPPAMDGTFFLSEYYDGFLRVIKKDPSSGQWNLVAGVSATDWGIGFGNVADMTVGPNGSVFYARLGSPAEIRMISYVGPGVPEFTLTPAMVGVLLVVVPLLLAVVVTGSAQNMTSDRRRERRTGEVIRRKSRRGVSRTSSK